MSYLLLFKRFMKKGLLTIVQLVIGFCSVAQEDAFKASWISPVKIDGNPQEWNLPLHYYDNITKLFFAFANDEEKLYLCFQTHDEMTQSKIMQAGMKVSVGFKGKHKVMVYFPLEQKTAFTLTADNRDALQRTDRENRRKNFLVQQNMMEVKGFISREGTIPIHDSSGINAAMNWDAKNAMTYEISIPLKEIFGPAYTSADLSKILTMDAIINALKEHLETSGGTNPYSRRAYSERMGAGKGSGNKTDKGMNETNPLLTREERAEMFEKSEFTQRFTLAHAKSAN